MGKKRSTFRVLVGNAKGNRNLVKPWHMWEDMVKVDLKKQYHRLVWYGMDWIL
jgi:hypothetical protein